jgi:hypothetical protein
MKEINKDIEIKKGKTDYEPSEVMMESIISEIYTGKCGKCGAKIIVRPGSCVSCTVCGAQNIYLGKGFYIHAKIERVRENKLLEVKIGNQSFIPKKDN